MANRPIYIPSDENNNLVVTMNLEFDWSPGFAISQKQKSIRSLHKAAEHKNLRNVLEISSKSENPLGVKLSAFNLVIITASGVETRVENAFQAGKVFQQGGPYQDLLTTSAREAKRDPRLTSSGGLVKFQMGEDEWPLQPITAFYDWLYLTALKQSVNLAEQLLQFDGFSDIEFNPARSLNCQAASAALFVALVRRGELESVTATKDAFLERMVSSVAIPRPIQASLL
jgi:hypothetical protein